MATLPMVAGLFTLAGVAPQNVTGRVGHAFTLRNERDRDVATDRRSVLDAFLCRPVHLALLLSDQRPNTSSANMTGGTSAPHDKARELSPPIDPSSVLKLPAEILLEVLSLLNVADLLSVREVRR